MAGGGGGNWWKWVLPLGFVLVVAGLAMEASGLHAPFLLNALLAIGGLGVIAGSCECMILCVEGLAGKLRWNEYVAGTIASIASNLPEVALIAFVVAEDVRIAFVVTMLALHINTLVFSIFCVLLPRDERGHARLPNAMAVLGTDMVAFAAGLFIAMGLLMLAMAEFDVGVSAGKGFGSWDLVAIGGVLLVVLVMYLISLVRRFSGTSTESAGQAEGERSAPVRSWKTTAFYGVLGSIGALLGGHAVSDFADNLVLHLRANGYSEMIAAIVVAFLAGAASYILVTSAHFKGKTQLALSNVFGAVIQAPFVILPAALISAVLFTLFGVMEPAAAGVILPIDLETVSVVLFAFPTLLVLWRAISDDGSVNRLETTIMLGLFALVLYLLAMHG